MEHSEIHAHWYNVSNYLGFLSVKDEYELVYLIDKAIALDIKISVFREPDIDNQITAIAIEPGLISKKLCSNMRLALKE